MHGCRRRSLRCTGYRCSCGACERSGLTARQGGCGSREVPESFPAMGQGTSKKGVVVGTWKSANAELAADGFAAAEAQSRCAVTQLGRLPEKALLDLSTPESRRELQIWRG